MPIKLLKKANVKIYSSIVNVFVLFTKLGFINQRSFNFQNYIYYILMTWYGIVINVIMK